MSAGTDYPSIISQPGSAGRNYRPILDALRPWVQRLTPCSSAAIAAPAPSSASAPKILEIGSYPYSHITGFATEFPGVQWHGSARDASEIQGIQEALSTSTSTSSGVGKLPNLHPPVMLDIDNQQHWAALAQAQEQEGPYDAVVMLNVIHCCPEGMPNRVFQHLSPSSGLLKPGGWIAVYGPFLADDGSYRTPGDEEFDKTYIRAHDPRLGLRSIPSITALAAPHGFQEVEKKEMPKGNMWVVWQLHP